MDGSEPSWWKEGVIYQVYPASFKDSNGDGLGDIPGIISKIDYIHSLGVDIVWLSPMYESPQRDMGYDISNYESVHAPYGTVQNIEILIEACHARGMRLLLDLVVNHTSDQHHWFKESRSSKDNPMRDWYIWRPPRYAADGTRMPPTNWLSFFQGSSWEWDEHTQEYYLHLFAKEQPDLNWENPAARKAIYRSAMEFWLKKGIDGFRIDVVNMYSKGSEFADAPVTDPTAYEQPAHHLFCNGPRMHEFLREMHDQVLSKYDAMTVGEAQFTPDPAHVLRYVGANDKQLNMVFQFDIMDLGQGKTYKYGGDGEWVLSEFKTIMNKWQGFIAGTDGWTTAFAENHDYGRSVSRFASDAPEWRERSAKMLAIMLTAMTGTLFIYQGQEIGMINAPKSWGIEDYQDIESVNFYNVMKERRPEMLPAIMQSIQKIGRDHPRLPMQWDDSKHAGFTTAKRGPWMRVHDAYKEINVKQQETDPNSVLNFWRQMLQTRKQNREHFIHGTFGTWDIDNDHTFFFSKTVDGHRDRIVVCLNFTAEDQPVCRPEWAEGKKWTLMVNNVDDVRDDTLAPYEGRIYTVAT